MSIIHRVSPTGPAEAAYAANTFISTEFSTPITLKDPISKIWALTDKFSNSATTLDLSSQDCKHFDIHDYSPHIHALDLSNNEDLFINPKTLDTLTKLPLQSLFLHGINNGQETIIKHLTASSFSILNGTLSTLDLSGYFIDSKQLKPLISALPRLTKLGMHNCNLNTVALNTVLQNYASQLKYIDASNNKITQFKMLESWILLPEKPASPKKLPKQFSFSDLSKTPANWVINGSDHQIFQPPIDSDLPSFLIDLRGNPLSSDTLEALKLRFDQKEVENTFYVFYNTQTQTYILTDLPKLESPIWFKA